MPAVPAPVPAGAPAPTTATAAAATRPPSSARRDTGYRTGDPAYRRIAIALFAAGLATFALLYSTQALLPELADTFGVSAGQSTLSLSLTTAGLGIALLVAGPLSEVRRPHPADPPLARAVLAGRARLRARARLARPARAAAAAGRRAGRAAGGRHRVPARGAAPRDARPRGRPLHRRHRARRHDRAADHRGGGGRRRLAVGAGRDRRGGAGVRPGGTRAAARLPASSWRRRPGWTTWSRMTRRALGDRALLALYGIGACSMGAFVAVFNAMGFRLTSAPYSLGLGRRAGLPRLPGRHGQLDDRRAGGGPLRAAQRRPDRLRDHRGRPAADAAGALPVVVPGLAVMTAGFFVVHGVASGWVPTRAHAGGVAAGTGRLAVPVRLLPGLLGVRQPRRPRLDGRPAGRPSCCSRWR